MKHLQISTFYFRCVRCVGALSLAFVVACGDDSSATKDGGADNGKDASSQGGSGGGSSGSGGKAGSTAEAGSSGSADKDAGDGSSIGDGGTSCGNDSADASLPGSCTKQDISDYQDCYKNACKTERGKCISSDGKSGICASYTKCARDCGCDTTCITNCNESDECSTCETAYAKCAQAACKIPSCFFPDAGAVAHTCADLKTCCDGLSGQDQTSCNSVYDAASGLDQVCSAAYESLCGA